MFNKAEIRLEEQNEKAELPGKLMKQNTVEFERAVKTEINTLNRIKWSGQARLVYVKTKTATYPPSDDVPVGSSEGGGGGRTVVCGRIVRNTS